MELAYSAHSMGDQPKPGSSPRSGDAAAQRKAEEERQAAEKAATEAAEKREALDLPADATDEEVEKAEEAATAPSEEEEVQEAEGPQRYPVEELLENARTLTGFSRHLLAGALSGKDRETFTVEEAKAAAKSFSKRKVGEEEK